MKTTSAIIADKELFRLWYEFYRLALQSSDPAIKKALKKSSNFYADWDAHENLYFDEWWKTHRSLFLDSNRVAVTAIDAVRTGDNLYVTVPRGKAYGDILQEFKILIEQELPSLVKGRKTPPTHRYAPTEIQGVKRDPLRLLLALQKNVFADSTLQGLALRERVIKFFSSERYKRKENVVPMSFMISKGNRQDDHSPEADRSVRRYRQKGKKLLLNVASGQFPGKY